MTATLLARRNRCALSQIDPMLTSTGTHLPLRCSTSLKCLPAGLRSMDMERGLRSISVVLTDNDSVLFPKERPLGVPESGLEPFLRQGEREIVTGSFEHCTELVGGAAKSARDAVRKIDRDEQVKDIVHHVEQ